MLAKTFDCSPELFNLLLVLRCEFIKDEYLLDMVTFFLLIYSLILDFKVLCEFSPLGASSISERLFNAFKAVPSSCCWPERAKDELFELFFEAYAET